MEENKDFNLIYYHKETRKKYFVKWITRLDFRILDPETKTKMPISRHALDKNFEADKANKRAKKKTRLNFKNFNKKR